MSQQSSLTPEEAERVRIALRELYAGHDSQAALANALVMPDGHPVSQQVISATLHGHKPAGVSLARAVAGAMGITFDELVSGRRLQDSKALVARYDLLPGWKEGAAELVAKQGLPRYAVAAAGKMPASLVPERATTALVYDVTMLWMRHAPLEVRIACERAEVDEDMARHEALHEERRKPVARSGERLREPEDAGVASSPAPRAKARR